MDIFDFRDALTRDYAEYVRSFIRIATTDIADVVDRAIEDQLLWPEPIVQLNPSYQPGAYIRELIDEGTLHETSGRVFRRGKDTDPSGLGEDLRLYQHQVEAIRLARDGHDYVVTTGTGSGKSLTYIIPIVDDVIRRGGGRGIKAIIVYPMNALANSQARELEKFLQHGFSGRAPVTFKRYTGQDDDAARNAIIADPPDILLTNYVMLELILTRSRERELVRAAEGLRFLVFDELHTYRGRQGADVAMLIRRVRERVGGDGLRCVGTSATMSSKGSLTERKQAVADVATRVFGRGLDAAHVIGETLQRVTRPLDLRDPDLARSLAASLADTERVAALPYPAFVEDPLCAWIEAKLGVTEDDTTGELVRAEPRRLTGEHGLAGELAELTRGSEADAAAGLRQLLLAGFEKPDPDPAGTRAPAFAFRLHQFLSRGEAVYASLRLPGDRYVTLKALQRVPNRREEVLLPLTFCRECGHEYYTVWRQPSDESGRYRYAPRQLSQLRAEGDAEPGFLYLDPVDPWPAEDSDELLDRLPNEWVEEHKGERRVVRSRRGELPLPVDVEAGGYEGNSGLRYQYLTAPFRFCLKCGVHYPGRRNDFSKLSVLSTGGRATATTVLSLAAVKQLQASDLPTEARKLLSFTDNRQDASLQAGHFNDFVDIGMLRGAVVRAAGDAGPEGLAFEDVPRGVFDALALDFGEYARDPEWTHQARRDTERALRDVLAYRVLQDLQRGWRITSPNLEQVGLIEIGYDGLDEIAGDQPLWANAHAALASASSDTRERVSRVLLDVMRRELALHARALDPEAQETIRSRSHQRLRDPWALDDGERLQHAFVLFPRARTPRDTAEHVFLSGRSRFGQYLRRDDTLPHLSARPDVETTEVIIRDLLERLRIAGLLLMTHEPRAEGDVAGYRLVADVLRWHARDGGSPHTDPLTTVRRDDAHARANAFFLRFYRETARHLGGLEAREHTAQVPNALRQEREAAFRAGNLPILYCSPTMELGVDIADLNVVNLRNVPPTPANYAQRSGRAGRSGQPALVFTYASSGNAHDQYFFQRQNLMVAGVVTPPRLDLANEDLLRAHVHAVWLSETRQDLGQSLREVLDLGEPALPLLDNVRSQLSDARALQRAAARAEAMLRSDLPQFQAAPWFHPDWMNDTLRNALASFDRACDRWRDLYRNARTQVDVQTALRNDATKSAWEKQQAERLRREAEQKIDLLSASEGGVQGDFYSYRYFASEGFLPGYSFPRLPLAAYIPGRGPGRLRGRDEFVQRPRFLAIREFGPRAIVYHEGSKYRVTRVNFTSADDGDLSGNHAKLCEVCGYLHPITTPPGPDTCEHCTAELPGAITDLLRLQDVSTRRAQRINSDEEERQRLGYDIITALRFAHADGQPVKRPALITRDGETLAELTGAPAATLWRINLGWRHRENKARHGFVLDLQNGTWASDKALQEDDNDDPETSEGRHKLVVPFVEDTRNALIWRPTIQLDSGAFLSLRDALKNAIQVEYQLEDSELGVELLPSTAQREPHSILYYEAAEGGAGVLRQLLDDPSAIARVARRALEICHFDPDSGDDLGHAPHARERCEAACYDCLMSYANQSAHVTLDRFAIRQHLQHLANATVTASPTHRTRTEHLQHLLNLCQSDLERELLHHLERRQLRLPTHAQRLADGVPARPDFLYLSDSVRAAIYVDGPHHDHPERQARDRDQERLLDAHGYAIVRFHHRDSWDRVIDEHAWLFGSAS